MLRWELPLLSRFAGFWRFAAGLLLCNIMLLAGLMLRHRNKMRRNAYDKLLLEHRAVNALLNPHFLFNAISNIEGLIRMGAGTNAEFYLHELSRMIRRNMDNLRQDLIPLERELDLIQAYIRLQNLRASAPVHLTIESSCSSAEAMEIPPLLLQTFIENAVVHGRTGMDMLQILLQIDLSFDNYLLITIRDNGCGVYDAVRHRGPDADRAHMGIAFNRERLYRLNQFFGLKQSVEITDLSERGERGTEVVIIVSGSLHTMLQGFAASPVPGP